MLLVSALLLPLPLCFFFPQFFFSGGGRARLEVPCSGSSA